MPGCNFQFGQESSSFFPEPGIILIHSLDVTASKYQTAWFNKSLIYKYSFIKKQLYFIAKQCYLRRIQNSHGKDQRGEPKFFELVFGPSVHEGWCVIR
jgi:hypothetical protein